MGFLVFVHLLVKLGERNVVIEVYGKMNLGSIKYLNECERRICDIQNVGHPVSTPKMVTTANISRQYRTNIRKIILPFLLPVQNTIRYSVFTLYPSV